MNLIVNGLLEGIWFVVAGVTNFLYLLPDASIPTGMLNAFSTIAGALYPFRGIIPFDTLAVCVGILSTTILILGIYRFVKFGMKFIPFLG